MRKNADLEFFTQNCSTEGGRRCGGMSGSESEKELSEMVDELVMSTGDDP